MRRLKKLVTMGIFTATALSMSIPCLAQDMGSELTAESAEAAPRIVVHYEKEVRKYYEAISGGSIPQSIYYTEWSDEYNCECSGTLYLEHVTTIGTQIEATYRGDLSGNI